MTEQCWCDPTFAGSDYYLLKNDTGCSFYETACFSLNISFMLCFFAGAIYLVFCFVLWCRLLKKSQVWAKFPVYSQMMLAYVAAVVRYTLLVAQVPGSTIIFGLLYSTTVFFGMMAYVAMVYQLIKFYNDMIRSKERLKCVKTERLYVAYSIIVGLIYVLGFTIETLISGHMITSVWLLLVIITQTGMIIRYGWMIRENIQKFSHPTTNDAIVSKKLFFFTIFTTIWLIALVLILLFGIIITPYETGMMGFLIRSSLLRLCQLLLFWGITKAYQPSLRQLEVSENTNV